MLSTVVATCSFPKHRKRLTFRKYSEMVFSHSVTTEFEKIGGTDYNGTALRTSSAHYPTFPATPRTFFFLILGCCGSPLQGCQYNSFVTLPHSFFYYFCLIYGRWYDIKSLCRTMETTGILSIRPNCFQTHLR